MGEHSFSRQELHNQEERYKRAFRDQIAEVSSMVEIAISVMVLIGLFMACVPVLRQMPGLLSENNSETFSVFLEDALNLVIGVEFIKMLAKHSPGAALEVLLYAIARHMVLSHNSAVDNLVGVASIALIFVIRRYFFVPSFGHGHGHGECPNKAKTETSAEQKPCEDDPDLTMV